MQRVTTKCDGRLIGGTLVRGCITDAYRRKRVQRVLTNWGRVATYKQSMISCNITERQPDNLTACPFHGEGSASTSVTTPPAMI
eukprot:1157540-Pelagomonas_calceolata.AAC.12